MTPGEERKYLAAVLAEIERPIPRTPPIWWIFIALWVIAAAAMFVIYNVGSPLSPFVLAVSCLFFGMFLGLATCLVKFSDSWPYLRRHISRDSIRSRLDELATH